jgi:hypothetical protein
MKSVAIWIFWIVIAIAGWRWLGPAVRDFDDKTFCTYKNAEGDCLTQAEYIKMVARDAATDAITDFVSFCNGPFGGGDPRCSSFRHN